jgi:predicted GIY-YIG superfamily endonuclease
MASGIYRLTFSSGKYYVGKSLDLETRWKQHFNKFATGKAARPMQLEYDRCGLPQTEVIFDCHRDHIDILEELLIDQLKGPDMLNTTYPEVNRTDEIAILINNSRDLLNLSTFEHLELLHRVEAKITEFREQKTAAEAVAQEYRTKGYIIDQDYSDMVDLAQQKQEDLEAAEHLARTQRAELDRLKNLSWLDRLFGYKVYV